MSNGVAERVVPRPGRVADAHPLAVEFAGGGIAVEPVALVADRVEGERKLGDGRAERLTRRVLADHGGADINAELTLVLPPGGGEQLRRRELAVRRGAVTVGGDEHEVLVERARSLVHAVTGGPDEALVGARDGASRADVVDAAVVGEVDLALPARVGSRRLDAGRGGPAAWRRLRVRRLPGAETLRLGVVHSRGGPVADDLGAALLGVVGNRACLSRRCADGARDEYQRQCNPGPAHTSSIRKVRPSVSTENSAGGPAAFERLGG